VKKKLINGEIVKVLWTKNKIYIRFSLVWYLEN